MLVASTKSVLAAGTNPVTAMPLKGYNRIRVIRQGKRLRITRQTDWLYSEIER